MTPPPGTAEEHSRGKTGNPRLLRTAGRAAPKTMEME